MYKYLKRIYASNTVYSLVNYMTFLSSKSLVAVLILLTPLITDAGNEIAKPSACAQALENIKTFVGDVDFVRTLRSNPKLLFKLKGLMQTYGISEAEVNKLTADGLPIFEELPLATGASPTGRGEVFAISGGRIQIDIDKAYWMIENGKINAPLIKKDLSSYAESAYGLNRALGWSVDTNRVENGRGAFTIAIGVTIDRGYAASLSKDRLDQPGLLLEYVPDKFLIIDGNHRAARRYMDGEDFMNFYVINHSDFDKIKVP